MKINIYDFDNTIYHGDSTVDFYKFCLNKRITILKRLPRFFYFAILYKLNKTTKDNMKENFFSFLQDFEDIDFVVAEFWKKHKKNIKSFYQNKSHSQDVIISASPFFLLKPICDELKVKELMASPVDKKTGKYQGKNCHGVEKVRRLKEKYPDIIVESTYTDSLSDKPILDLAKASYLVKGNKIVKYNKDKKQK